MAGKPKAAAAAAVKPMAPPAKGGKGKAAPMAKVAGGKKAC
jgi:hypothetical protein